MSRTRLVLALLALVAVLATVAACGDEGDEAQQAATSTTPDACLRDDLDTIEPGVLTVGTDTPAFPPYFDDDDPTNGKGFESAVAYAIADQLGFATDEVKWIRVPFNSSYAPGPKKFDFDINQISITPARAKQRRLLGAVLHDPAGRARGRRTRDVASATSVAELKDAKIGVQVGTTSLDAVEPVIDAVASSRRSSTTPTTSCARSRRSRSTRSWSTCRRRSTCATPRSRAPRSSASSRRPGGDDWGVVLEKGSTLTACVNQALAALRASGELEQITDQWIGAEAPVLDLE